jgi:hypothetical protein
MFMQSLGGRAERLSAFELPILQRRKDEKPSLNTDQFSITTSSGVQMRSVSQPAHHGNAARICLTAFSWRMTTFAEAGEEKRKSKHHYETNGQDFHISNDCRRRGGCISTCPKFDCDES